MHIGALHLLSSFSKLSIDDLFSSAVNDLVGIGTFSCLEDDEVKRVPTFRPRGCHIRKLQLNWSFRLSTTRNICCKHIVLYWFEVENFVIPLEMLYLLRPQIDQRAFSVNRTFGV